MTFAPLPPAIEALARSVVNAGFQAHNALGPGLLESAYEYCMAYELERSGCAVRRQVALPIVYEGVKLEAGYRIDLLIGEAVIVEVKAVDAIAPIHQAQLLTYMKLSGRHLGFLMNFNVPLFKQGLRRMVL